MILTIDDILRGFFSQRLEGKTGVARRRILFVHDSLRLYLELKGTSVLTNGELALLELERSLEPTDGLARIMFADVLVLCLEGYLNEPVADAIDRRAQITTVEALLQRILDFGLIDEAAMVCSLLDLRRTIRMAKRASRSPRSR